MFIDGVQIKGVTCDSRKVEEGFAFFACKGEKTDGHFFINEAIEKGAAIIYTDREVELVKHDKVIIKKVDNTRKFLSEVCHEFYGFPSEKMKVVGVTGTNGKTTTTHLIYNVLRSQGISVGLIGTLYIKINDKTFDTKLTTPDAEDICYYMDLMVKENVQVVVMEVSSHALESYRACGIQFDIAVHTNIDVDHLNHHKTMENYISSKKKLFDQLPSGKIALINLDDEHGLKLLDSNDKIVVITYGLNSKSTITASSFDVDYNVAFTYCLQRGLTTLSGLEIEPFEYPIATNLLGKHNMYNLLAAITCCLLLDIPIENISQSLKIAIKIFRRMEIVYNKDFVIIDDTCHNPSSYDTVFNTVQNMQFKNLHIVNAIRGNRGEDINIENAEVICNWAGILNIKNILITSSKDCVTKKDTVSSSELNRFIKVFNDNNIVYEYHDKLYEAIEKVIDYVEEGDLILLLGAQGMDMGTKFALSLINTNNQLNFHHSKEQIGGEINNYLT
ncbi:Mur ligase family protein [Serpentinicella alkaliphila]|uniref:UDP-N-acetylmuramoylalanyl-D-glutamate--2, 6-diaminopimelate ligase n=1 Tax=Serpentinicella alkaliphila TaxID=1734049 RepID=A0A4R2TL54_9FIRM|nr:UDP-N-acetylmuramyl-tripeptide synthetase [Serpentinicella alkaliphila]QUH24464.1 UDP-N-acetylmuramyl-tripeptide synthetase [Serpentinicella alkaliphila]TCQ04141.1 UDP-N-acetylmuramoylalanyl-D-glutamate--2,6-diaminopimelate ligase [Serpentinicella alkaliphila]